MSSPAEGRVTRSGAAGSEGPARAGDVGGSGRGRRRWLRWLLVACGVLLLLWGVDALARVAAQSVVASRIEAAAGLQSPPQVQIDGLLFLPQVVRGRYGHAEVDLDGAEVQRLRLGETTADLFGIRVPFRDLVDGKIEQVVVARTESQTRIRYEDLNAYLRANGQPLTVSAGQDGRARVSGTVTVAGQPVQLAGEVALTVAEGKLEVRPGGAGSAQGNLGLGQGLSVTVPLPELPYGQRLRDVRTDADGLQLGTSGTDVVLPG